MPTNTQVFEESINGIQMHGRIRGTGRPLLLLHGGTGTGADWDHIFPEPPAGKRLVIPDLRGHGRSTNPDGGFTIRQLAQDVDALLDRLSIATCDAIGMSLGAKTLLHLSLLSPDRVGAMVLVSAAPYFPQEARAIMAHMTPNRYGADDWAEMRQKHAFGDKQITMLWQQMHAFKDSYDDLNFTPPMLSLIRARTLIVHGDSDPLYPVSLALELHGAIPDASLWVVPGAGHVPIFGACTLPFVTTVQSFLHGPKETG